MSNGNFAWNIKVRVRWRKSRLFITLWTVDYYSNAALMIGDRGLKVIQIDDCVEQLTGTNFWMKNELNRLNLKIPPAFTIQITYCQLMQNI